MHRIGLDFEKLKYPHNGLYTFCLQLGQRLLNLQQQNEQLLYYMPESFTGFNGRFETIPYKWYDRYAFFTEKMDVFHAVHQTGNVWPRRQAKKALVTIHDLNFLFDQRLRNWQKQHHLRQLQKQVDETDIVVSISKFTLSVIREHIKVPESKCHIVYQGSEVKQFPGFDTPSYKPQKPFLFSIGMLTAKKNFHVLPALLMGNDYELIIAGRQQGDYIKKIEAAAAELGVSNRLKLVGGITDEEKYWYYSQCLAFLFPSLAEGFGAPVVEAMHFGKPVFLSDKTSLPEVGGEVAYYFRDFAPDAMQDVFAKGLDHFAGNDRADAIKKHALQFSWDANAKAYFELYRSLY